MMRPIEPEERERLGIKPGAEVYVTDDDPKSLDQYNCLASVRGRRRMFMPATSETTVTDLLRRVGLRPQDPTAAEKQIAVYKEKDVWYWHVAKHIGEGWYESKCFDGLRIVHRPDCFLDEGYGPVESYWEVDGEDAHLKLEQALWDAVFELCSGSDEVRWLKALAWMRELELAPVVDSKPPA